MTSSARRVSTTLGRSARAVVDSARGGGPVSGSWSRRASAVASTPIRTTAALTRIVVRRRTEFISNDTRQEGRGFHRKPVHGAQEASQAYAPEISCPRAQDQAQASQRP